MATAVLENVNKFSYLGLRRRPTYNEIIGLIKENETLTGELPNRDATFFKASNEGSFFDGLDSLEVLKEQQHRILQRQMQDLLLRQNVRENGGTFHLERHMHNTPSSSSSSSTPISVGSDFGTLRTTGIQAELQERARQTMSRQQQTGGAHAEQTSQQARLPTLDSFLSNITSPLQKMIRPLPIPSRQPQTIDLTTDHVEEAQQQFFPEEMTARDVADETPELDKKQELIFYSLKAVNPDASRAEFDNAFKILDKFKDVKSGTLVRNQTNRDSVFGTMHKTGYITQPTFNQYLELVEQEKQASGQENKEAVRNEMGRLYTNAIYNKYIAPMSVRKGAETKAKARKSTSASSSMGV